jgi:hypothetical protein
MEVYGIIHVTKKRTFITDSQGHRTTKLDFKKSLTELVI